MFGNLVLVLLCVSFIFIAPARFDWDQMFCLGACMGLSVLSFAIPPKRYIPLKYPILLFLLILATLASNFFYHKLLVVFNCFIGLVTIKTLAERLETGFITKLGYVLTAFCALSIIYVWMQQNGLDPIYQPTFNDVGGSFGKPWALGSMAVMAMPFVWNIRKWLIVLPALLVFHSHSVLCVFAAYFVLLMLVRKRYMIIGLILMIASVCWYISYECGVETHRIQVWKGVWPYAMETPWFGHGIGSFLHRAFAHSVGPGQIQHQPWLHNEFYQYFYEQGAIGLGILGAWITSMLFVKNRITRAALAGLCILCMFHPVMHWGRLIFLGCLIIALSEIEKSKNQGGLWALIRMKILPVWPCVSLGRKA